MQGRGKAHFLGPGSKSILTSKGDMMSPVLPALDRQFILVCPDSGSGYFRYLSSQCCAFRKNTRINRFSLCTSIRTSVFSTCNNKGKPFSSLHAYYNHLSSEKEYVKLQLPNQAQCYPDFHEREVAGSQK